MFLYHVLYSNLVASTKLPLMVSRLLYCSHLQISGFLRQRCRTRPGSEGSSDLDIVEALSGGQVDIRIAPVAINLMLNRSS